MAKEKKRGRGRPFKSFKNKIGNVHVPESVWRIHERLLRKVGVVEQEKESLKRETGIKNNQAYIKGCKVSKKFYLKFQTLQKKSLELKEEAEAKGYVFEEEAQPEQEPVKEPIEEPEEKEEVEVKENPRTIIINL